jgi:hypothetical protein
VSPGTDDIVITAADAISCIGDCGGLVTGSDNVLADSGKHEADQTDNQIVTEIDIPSDGVAIIANRGADHCGHPTTWTQDVSPSRYLGCTTANKPRNETSSPRAWSNLATSCATLPMAEYPHNW